MQERATQLQGQEARQRAETQRGDQQAWDADAERPRRSCGGQPHVPDVRSEDRGDVRPQAPAGFRGARLLRIDFQRQGRLDARCRSAPVSVRLARAVVAGEGRCSRVGCCFRTRSPSAATCTVRLLDRTLRASWPAQGSSSVIRSCATSSRWASSTTSSSSARSIARPTPVPGVRRRKRAGAASAPGRPVPGGRLSCAGMEDRRQPGLRLLPRAAAGVLTLCSASRTIHPSRAVPMPAGVIVACLTSPSWWLRSRGWRSWIGRWPPPRRSRRPFSGEDSDVHHPVRSAS